MSPSRYATSRAARSNQSGLTLTELLVALTIISVLAVAAVPALSRDHLESDFRSFVLQLEQHLRQARIEAISNREDRMIFLTGAVPQTYSFEAAVPGTTTTSPIKSAIQVPNRVAISGVIGVAAEPGVSYAPPGILPAEIRFTGTGTAELALGGSAGTTVPLPQSSTIFVETDNSEYRARIVTFGTTGFSRVYWEW